VRLTSYTDYSLRTLMYLAMHGDRLATIQEIADLHGISKNHLMKVVHQLGLAGHIETVRGRNGGLRLKRPAADINIGALVRSTETDFFMAECFDRANNTCPLTPDCQLKWVLNQATQAFLAVLDGATLASLLPQPGAAQVAGVIHFHPPIKVDPVDPAEE
jgi:Rrf2 family nitric oxide-sensitive transcriptional repressor